MLSLYLFFLWSISRQRRYSFKNYINWKHYNTNWINYWNMWNINFTWSNKTSNRNTFSYNCNLFFIIFIFWEICSWYNISRWSFIKKISRIPVVWSRSNIWDSNWCICRFYFFICFIWSFIRNCWWRKIFPRFSICNGWKNERWSC